MRGIEFAEVRDVISRAFTPDEFDMFLFERFDLTRGDVVANAPFKKVVFDVITYMAQQGLDATLIAEVAAARPLKRDVQDVFAKYAQELVDEGRRHSIDAARREAIERFGLGPRVSVQTSGAVQTAEPLAGTDKGLEKSVKPYLPFIDVALWRQQLFRLEGCVCRVEIDGSGIGTGFLVGPDTLLTNYHVLKSVLGGAARGVRLRFDYRVLPGGRTSDGTLVSLAATDWLVDSTPYTAAEGKNRPDAEVPTDDQLDFALVRLERAIGNESLNALDKNSSPRGWVRIPSSAPAVAPNAPILILQHPNTLPLKLAVDTAGVMSFPHDGKRIRYATNTEPGSSGSPCFDIEWRLIALHHLGDPLHSAPEYNQGIPITLIRDRLQRQNKLAALGGDPPAT